MDQFSKEEIVMTTDTSTIHVHQAREIFDAHRNRTICFSCSHIFGDPAWEILTVLFMATEQHRSVAVSEIGETTRIAATAVTRWLRVLEKEGLVEESFQPVDLQQPRFRLTENAVASFRTYLDGSLS